MEENVEVWRRDVVECVEELIGNPAFKDYMSYVAEHVYLDKEGKVRIFDEMWTADWWWNTQVSLPNIYKALKLTAFYKEKTSRGCNDCSSYPFFRQNTADAVPR